MVIGTMDCNGGVASSDNEGPVADRVASGGGSVNINSLDGIGEIDSGGGPIKVIDCLRRGLLFYLINDERVMLCIYCVCKLSYLLLRSHQSHSLLISIRFM